MNRIPFSVYDFFGYLASGFLLLVSVDYLVAGGQWIVQDDPGVILGLFWVVVAYITGQILANLAAWLLERIVVGKWLKRPNTNLFQDPPKIRSLIFAGYYTPLPETMRKRVQDKAKSDGFDEKGEGLFQCVFGKVKADKNALDRLNDFRDRYGFCRNVSFTCLLIAILIVVVGWQTQAWDKLTLALAAAAIGAVGMFYRYLKFFRQYSYELFITYAALPAKEPTHAS